MSLRRVSLFSMFVLFVFSVVFAADYDKQYAKTYGTGIVIASDIGLPARDKFDKSQVDFKNGVFYIKGGAESSISIRAFIKDGNTFRYYIDSLKKKYKPETIIENSEKIVFQVWASHSIAGKNEMRTDSNWPKKLGDTPNWTDFGLQVWGIGELSDYKDMGLDWKDLNSTERPAHFQGESLVKWLANAKPGYKLYIQVYVSLVANHEWDTYNKRWITMLCKGEPFAAGTIEIK